MGRKIWLIAAFLTAIFWLGTRNVAETAGVAFLIAIMGIAAYQVGSDDRSVHKSPDSDAS